VSPSVGVGAGEGDNVGGVEVSLAEGSQELVGSEEWRREVVGSV